MKKEEIKQCVIEILKEIDPAAEFDEETDLLEEILDSMGIVYLLAELMGQAHIEIPMTEVTALNFSTVNSIAELAEKYDAGKEKKE